MDPKQVPMFPASTVGQHTFPLIGAKYYAKSPRPNFFRTVWLPVNAANSRVTDPKQDIMLLYYSEYVRAHKKPSKGEKRVPVQLVDAEIDFPILVQQRKDVNRQRPRTPPPTEKAAMWMCNRNSMAPFTSMAKPTCGYYFSRKTDNKKRLTGIPPTNPVLWRSKGSMPTC